MGLMREPIKNLLMGYNMLSCLSTFVRVSRLLFRSKASPQEAVEVIVVAVRQFIFYFRHVQPVYTSLLRAFPFHFLTFHIAIRSTYEWHRGRMPPAAKSHYGPYANKAK